MPETLSKSTLLADAQTIPSTMKAAVYRGMNDVRLEEVPVPEIGRGEILVRVHTCGICGTDLKKIASGSHSAPRIFGHETSGVVARIGQEVRKFAVGDRVVVFHHIPCGNVITAAARLSHSVRPTRKSAAPRDLSPPAEGSPSM